MILQPEWEGHALATWRLAEGKSEIKSLDLVEFCRAIDLQSCTPRPDAFRHDSRPD